MSDEKLELAIGTLADILAKDDTHSEGIVVPVPEWGVSVRIRGLTRGEVREVGGADGIAEVEALSLSYALLDPKVTVEEARELLAGKSYLAGQRLVDRIAEVSGLTEEFREE